MDGALPSPQLELDAELLEVAALLDDRDIVEVLPERQIAGPAVLQIEGGLPSPLPLLGIGAGALHRRRIQLGELVERHRRLVWIGPRVVGIEVGQLGPAVLQLRDELAHRHPPIAEVDVSVDVVADESEEPLQALPDDRSPEMANMHRLRHVGAAVVDQDLQARVGLVDPEAIVVGHGLGVFGEQPVGHRDVDEPGSGDVELGKRRSIVQGRDDVGGDLAWVAAGLLGGTEGTVALELGELRPLGRHDETPGFVEPDRGKGPAKPL